MITAALILAPGTVGKTEASTTRRPSMPFTRKSLSTTAHNVKILAENGVITLRGPGKSDAEKAQVEALAKQVAGVTSVQNNLDIKTN